MKAGLVAVGSYVPERRISNFDLEKLGTTTDAWQRQNTGILSRSRIGARETTTDTGAAAAQVALDRAGLAPDSIDLVICATNSPDHLYPSTAAKIQQRLGAHNASSFDLQAGCTGWLYGLKQAFALVKSGEANAVLVLGTEALTRSLNLSDRNSSLFGDAAGAGLVCALDQAASGFAAIFETRTVPSFCMQQPTIYTEENNALEEYLQGKDMALVRKPHPVMDGRATLRLALSECRALLDRALLKAREAGLAYSCFVPHQTSTAIIKALAEHVGFEYDKIELILPELGALSTACLPVAMDRLFRKNQLRYGEAILCASYGAGFTAGAALLPFTNPEAMIPDLIRS